MAQRGLGCRPVSTLKIIKRTVKEIILKRVETLFVFKRIMAAVVAMRYKRYLVESII